MSSAPDASHTLVAPPRFFLAAAGRLRGMYICSTTPLFLARSSKAFPRAGSASGGRRQTRGRATARSLLPCGTRSQDTCSLSSSRSTRSHSTYRSMVAWAGFGFDRTIHRITPVTPCAVGLAFARTGASHTSGMVRCAWGRGWDIEDEHGGWLVPRSSGQTATNRGYAVPASSESPGGGLNSEGLFFLLPVQSAGRQHTFDSLDKDAGGTM
jgi:hypothetical protein